MSSGETTLIGGNAKSGSGKATGGNASVYGGDSNQVTVKGGTTTALGGKAEGADGKATNGSSIKTILNGKIGLNVETGGTLVTAMPGERDGKGNGIIGNVEINTDGGKIEEVENALTPKDVRPLTDKVLVGSPETVEYALAGKWFLSSSHSTLLASITKAVDAAVEGYRLWQRSKPGRDINPDELIARMRNAGAKRVELETPVFKRLTETQIARETSVAMTFGGVEDE